LQEKALAAGNGRLVEWKANEQGVEGVQNLGLYIFRYVSNKVSLAYGLLIVYIESLGDGLI
jgi:hypothetical protein